MLNGATTIEIEISVKSIVVPGHFYLPY